MNASLLLERTATTPLPKFSIGRGWDCRFAGIARVVQAKRATARMVGSFIVKSERRQYSHSSCSLAEMFKHCALYYGLGHK